MKTSSKIIVPVLACAAGWCGGLLTADEPPVSAGDPRPDEPRRVTAIDSAAVPPGAVEEVKKAVDASADPGATARGWARSSPRSFYAWLLEARPQPSDEVVKNFFSEWILSNPDAAFDAACDMPARFGFRESPFPIAEEYYKLLSRDPGAALRWLGRGELLLGVGSYGLSPVHPDFKRPDFSGLDAQVLAEKLNSIPLSGGGREFAIGFARFLASTDPAGALAWAETLNPVFASQAIGPILEIWYASEPEAVFAYLEDAPSQVRQINALNILTEYAVSHPRAAMDWYEEHMGTSSYFGGESILANWTVGDPAGASDYVLALENPQQRQRALKGLARSLTYAREPSDTLIWVDKLPAGERITVFTEIIRRGMVRSTQPYLDYVGGLPQDDPYTHEVANRIGLRLRMHRGKELDRAVAWVEAHPGPVSERIVRGYLAPVPGGWNPIPIPPGWNRIPRD